MKYFLWKINSSFYITVGIILCLRKVELNRTCTKTTSHTNSVVNSWNSLLNHTVNKLKSYLNKFWQYRDIVCMIVKLKFMKPEAKVYIKINYNQYFVSFVFVMQTERHWPAPVISLRDPI